ncbi:GTPase IMAP family member 4 [Alosa sapidissima]|uniref:GTPase IMAP family member 4 n=1 Tax=Alosa sapidissima TaxID=34773 RepID=UPI001C099FF9|nr:GTPase IMAP family member 4 [Alosa sapidissima]
MQKTIFSSSAEQPFFYGQYRKGGLFKAMPRRDPNGDVDLRLVVIGSSGPAQFLLTNSILGKEEFTRDVCSIAGSRKNLGDLAGRRVAVINSPNLYEKDLSKAKMKEELRRAKCLSAPGPHAFLLAFDLDGMSPNDIKSPKLVVKRYGERSLNHAIILLAYDGNLEGQALDDRVMRTDSHLRELLEQCGCRYHIFPKNWQDRSQARELAHKIERMVTALGGHYYTSHSYQRAEDSVRKEVARLEKRREGETDRAWCGLEQQYQGDELRRQVDGYNSSIHAEIRARAELDNGWLRTTLATGVGVGFVVGAVMGMAIGSVEGPLGIVVGGVVGGGVGGGTGGAVQVAMEHLEDRIGPHPNNFNTMFINRFFRLPRSSFR